MSKGQNRYMEKTFEENIRDIETIISSMERGAFNLDDSIKNYEKGMRLIQECSKKLADAEKSLKVIEKKASGVYEEKDLEEHQKQDGSETVEAFREKVEPRKKKREAKKTEPEQPMEKEGGEELALF